MIRLETLAHHLVFLFAAGSGCGEDGTPRSDGAVADSSFAGDAGTTAPDSDAQPRQNVFSLRVGTAGAGEETHCLVYEGGAWDLATTEFDSPMGEPTNPGCVLVPVFVRDENQGYWVAGRDHLVVLRNQAFDNDEVRHAIATTEDPITIGRFDIELYPPASDFEVEAPLEAATLEVRAYMPDDGQVSLTIE